MNQEDPQTLDRDTVEIICFDFVQQLEDLFGNTTLFGDLNNLVINDSSVDPNRKWEPYDKKLDGDWYQKYGRGLVKGQRIGILLSNSIVY